MNTLSWLIYLAGVSGGLKGLAIAVGAAGIVALAGGVTYGAIVKDGYHVTRGDETWKVGHDIQIKALKRFPPLSIAAFLLAVFIPTSNTIYAIAASEMGETALKSETGGKAVQALNAWLDRQIEGETKE